MKIKINWGTAIVLAIISFMTFILLLVFTMVTNKEFNHDLVTEEYYKQELTFQDQLNREKNSQNLLANLQIEIEEEGVIVIFPAYLDAREITGKISMYRPSNKNQDFVIPVSLQEHKIMIPAKHLGPGRWNIEIDWNHQKEFYYFKKEFTF